MTNDKNELELKLKLETNDRNFELKQLQEKCRNYQEERQKTQIRMDKLEKERNDLKDASDNRFKYKSSEMENLIEDIQNKAHLEI